MRKISFFDDDDGDDDDENRYWNNEFFLGGRTANGRAFRIPGIPLPQ